MTTPSRACRYSSPASSFAEAGRTYSKIAATAVAALAIHAGWARSVQAQLPSAAPVPIVSPSFPAPSEASPAARIEGTIASVPLFARLSAEGTNLRSYSVPISLAVTIHKFLFAFHFRRNGTVQFELPDTLTTTIASVPKRYTDVFAELGTARTWPLIYDLELLGSDVIEGHRTYRLRGVPLQPSDVDHVLIETTEAYAPIEAQWFLHSGWTITSTIETEIIADHLVPKGESTDIVGHGFKIHSDMTYGNYTLNDAVITVLSSAHTASDLVREFRQTRVWHSRSDNASF
jgi:hypothetical protein